MQNLKTGLPIVEVAFEDNNQKVVFMMLDEEFGEVQEVSWNRQAYDKDSQKFVPDAKKAAEVDEWCEKYFGLPYERLGETIGLMMDVYCYERFSSFWEVKQIKKFTEDMVGQILTVEICEATDTGEKISLLFEYDGELYESKMQYASWVEAMNKFFANPVKRKKQYEKFEEKFGMPVENIADMVGKEVLVEVKKALGKHVYCEIKPFQKPKKKTS